MGDLKRVLLAPLDPVHDVGLKTIRRGLEEAGHTTILLPPDLPPEQVVQAALDHEVDCVLIGRTLGYQVAEILARFVDLAEAAGLRRVVRLAVGGMAIRPELAAELGFDAGFGPGTTVEEAVAFVEGRPARFSQENSRRVRPSFAQGYTYQVRLPRVEAHLEQIADRLQRWARGRSSPALERARIRGELLALEEEQGPRPEGRAGEVWRRLRADYARLSGPEIARFYERGTLPEQVRVLTGDELDAIHALAARAQEHLRPADLRRGRDRPLIFVQYGTGDPAMDLAHAKAAEAWGADGVVHFDPSWGARAEGLLEGYLEQPGDGTVITPENLTLLRSGLDPATWWQVRAHRGLNTPETVLLAGERGADLTKINPVYASLAAGTDPERMVVDALEAIRIAARYDLPFDVVTNEELAGVPARRAFAGMLAMAYLAHRLGGRPILQPLFCHSPEAIIGGLMEDNYVDFNTAKILALRQIIDAPIWPGAPVGFMTHTEDRVQSSVTSALHAALAAALKVDGVTIASADEAYSGGPITVPARIDTLRATGEALRFFGQVGMEVTERAQVWAEELARGVEAVLADVAQSESLVAAIYQGVLGDAADGAYPGRAGRGTVVVV